MPRKYSPEVRRQVVELARAGTKFTVTAPNRLWMTDITEHPTREGKVYCCVVLDAFSRKVVGWSIDTQQNTLLVTSALTMATHERNPGSDLVIHSDRVNWLDSTGPRNALIVEGLWAGQRGG